MERITRLKGCLEEWNTKSSHLKYLTKEIADDMRMEIYEYELQNTKEYTYT